MATQQSDASRFRDAFERAESTEREWQAGMPDRHPSIYQVRAIENGPGKSFAASFREVFEAALERAEAGLPSRPEQAQPLAYYDKGRPVIIEVDGAKRYVYDNGTIDRGSIVSEEVEARAFEIGSIATQAQHLSEGVPETDMSRIGAADLYGLYGEELDEHLAAGAGLADMPSPIALENGSSPASGQSEAQAA